MLGDLPMLIRQMLLQLMDKQNKQGLALTQRDMAEAARSIMPEGFMALEPKQQISKLTYYCMHPHLLTMNTDVAHLWLGNLTTYLEDPELPFENQLLAYTVLAIVYRDFPFEDKEEEKQLTQNLQRIYTHALHTDDRILFGLLGYIARAYQNYDLYQYCLNKVKLPVGEIRITTDEKKFDDVFYPHNKLKIILAPFINDIQEKLVSSLTYPDKENDMKPKLSMKNCRALIAIGGILSSKQANKAVEQVLALDSPLLVSDSVKLIAELWPKLSTSRRTKIIMDFNEALRRFIDMKLPDDARAFTTLTNYTDVLYNFNARLAPDEAKKLTGTILSLLNKVDLSILKDIYKIIPVIQDAITPTQAGQIATKIMTHISKSGEPLYIGGADVYRALASVWNKLPDENKSEIFQQLVDLLNSDKEGSKATSGRILLTLWEQLSHEQKNHFKKTFISSRKKEDSWELQTQSCVAYKKMRDTLTSDEAFNAIKFYINFIKKPPFHIIIEDAIAQLWHRLNPDHQTKAKSLIIDLLKSYKDHLYRNIVDTITSVADKFTSEEAHEIINFLFSQQIQTTTKEFSDAFASISSSIWKRLPPKESSRIINRCITLIHDANRGDTVDDEMILILIQALPNLWGVLSPIQRNKFSELFFKTFTEKNENFRGIFSLITEIILTAPVDTTIELARFWSDFLKLENIDEIKNFENSETLLEGLCRCVSIASEQLSQEQVLTILPNLIFLMKKEEFDEYADDEDFTEAPPEVIIAACEAVSAIAKHLTPETIAAALPKIDIYLDLAKSAYHANIRVINAYAKAISSLSAQLEPNAATTDNTIELIDYRDKSEQKILSAQLSHNIPFTLEDIITFNLTPEKFTIEKLVEIQEAAPTKEKAKAQCKSYIDFHCRNAKSPEELKTMQTQLRQHKEKLTALQEPKEFLGKTSTESNIWRDIMRDIEQAIGEFPKASTPPSGPPPPST